MNYIVFDLEFNQAWDSDKAHRHLNLKCPFEIIQIGAVKLDQDFSTVSSFNSLIKPVVYTTLHPFVKQITNIKEEDLKSARHFEEVYKSFIEILDFNSVLCVWGMADIKELLRNAQYHELDISKVPKEYINVQRYASKYLHCNKGSNVGLRNAVEIMNIPSNDKFHDALNDAYYTAEIFKQIYNENIKPVIYEPERKRRSMKTVGKTKLDIDRLMRQFEKMYNRPMTEEEQSIIKLAYLMGKTNQFQSNK